MFFEFFHVFCPLASPATQQMHSQRSTCGIYNDVIDNSLSYKLTIENLTCIVLPNVPHWSPRPVYS